MTFLVSWSFKSRDGHSVQNCACRVVRNERAAEHGLPAVDRLSGAGEPGEPVQPGGRPGGEQLRGSWGWMCRRATP